MFLLFTFHTNVQLHDFTANYLSLLHSLSQKGGRPRSNQPQMEENQIYVSVEEGKLFAFVFSKYSIPVKSAPHGTGRAVIASPSFDTFT